MSEKLRPSYRERPDLAALSKRRPEIAWLCDQPPAERHWYRTFDRLAALIDHHPDVSDNEWRMLLR